MDERMDILRLFFQISAASFGLMISEFSFCASQRQTFGRVCRKSWHPQKPLENCMDEDNFSANSRELYGEDCF